jgi:hypothetical protein
MECGGLGCELTLTSSDLEIVSFITTRKGGKLGAFEEET